MRLTPILHGFVAMLAVALPLAACDTYDDDFGFSGGSSGFGGIGGTSSSAPSVADVPRSPCDEVKVGDSCSSYQVDVCEIGENPNIACNQVFHCDFQTSDWQPGRASSGTTPPPFDAGHDSGKKDGGDASDDAGADTGVEGGTSSGADAGTSTVDPASCGGECPFAYGDPSDACASPATQGTMCAYPQGVCGCALPPSGGSGNHDGGGAASDGGDDADGGSGAGTVRVWRCVPKTPGCPTRRPRLGETCVGQVQCDYGSCVFDNGMAVRCDGLVWVEDGFPGSCP